MSRLQASRRYLAALAMAALMTALTIGQVAATTGVPPFPK